MDINFQSKILSLRGQDSDWLNNEPFSKIDSSVGSYCFCPFCQSDKRTVFLDASSTYCSGCAESYTYDELYLEAAMLGKVDLPSIGADQKNETNDHSFLSSVSEYYRFNLKYNPEGQVAKDYLANRGITMASCERFQIGFAPNTPETRLFHAFPNKTEWLNRHSLQLKSDKGYWYDRFRDRVMFPIRDIGGNILGFGGRILDSTAKGAKYLNSAESPTFHKGNVFYGIYEAFDSIIEKDAAILVEGYLDVICLNQFGVKTSLATMGTSLSENNVKTLYKLCNCIYLCFDSDKAGIKAVNSAIDLITPYLCDQNKQLRIVQLPEGEDPDSLLQSRGKTGFLHYVAKSLTPGEYLLQNTTKEELAQPMLLAKIFLKIGPLYRTGNINVMKSIIRKLSSIDPSWNARRIDEYMKHVKT